ncbi:hypothetical protein ETD86_32470 [Nonomuraea turkmeniaca]|uniref:Uncharacterized protein n=1 Tax=Nonomuraea turkmeniaca TaxID=103838 RepID=A0A5S4F819_9ACTN|nr:hypothetical protein [Nonomuraea turkmeniaca]TMR12603.1 hypothetical protein ETD86_32470 [Nonomuraea turkmeniaca]
MTVAGVIVLLVNDHLLKQAWPGFVTGKLSDVAGLVVAPALLALLLWRRADLAATVLTGVLFALVKTTETGAEAASQVWTLVAGPSRVLADPTDLLALPALALAWWVRRRSLSERSSPRWRVIVTMPLAVLAVTATSAAPGPPTAGAVEVKDDRIMVYADDFTIWESGDHGATWSSSSVPFDDIPPGIRKQLQKVKQPQGAACAHYQATRCYRVVPGQMAVEQSDDGGKSWNPSWSLSDRDERERLVRRYDDQSRLQSMGLAVQAWRGGHVVVVANGLDGIVVRDQSGTWRRLGWPGQEAESPAMDLFPEINLAIFLAGCLLFGAAGAGLRRYHRLYLSFAAAACLSYLAVANSQHLTGFADLDALVRLLGVITIPVGFVVCVALLITGRARPAPVAVGVLGAPLVYLSVYLPFHGWAAGTPGPYWVAVALAVVLTGLVLLAALALIRKDARQASSPAGGPAWPV